MFISDCSITKFLNRILGLEVHKQNSLFQYFTDNFDYLIEKDKKEGKYDMGILGTGGARHGGVAHKDLFEEKICNPICKLNGSHRRSKTQEWNVLLL